MLISLSALNLLGHAGGPARRRGPAAWWRFGQLTQAPRRFRLVRSQGSSRLRDRSAAPTVDAAGRRHRLWLVAGSGVWKTEGSTSIRGNLLLGHGLVIDGGGWVGVWTR